MGGCQERTVDRRLTDLEHRLDAAHDQYAQRRRHRDETARYRRQRRRLVAALVVLGVLVLALTLYILL